MKNIYVYYRLFTLLIFINKYVFFTGYYFGNNTKLSLLVAWPSALVSVWLENKDRAKRRYSENIDSTKRKNLYRQLGKRCSSNTSFYLFISPEFSSRRTVVSSECVIHSWWKTIYLNPCEWVELVMEGVAWPSALVTVWLYNKDRAKRR